MAITRGPTKIYSDFEPQELPSPSPARVVTEVGVEGNDVVYIYVQNEHMPPSKFHHELAQIQKEFKKAMPGTTVIVGAHDLKFTTITKKQEFKARLDGTLEGE